MLDLRMRCLDRKLVETNQLVREQIDGAAGSYRQWPGVRPADDTDYRRTYLARVRGEIDDQSWYSFLRSRQSTPKT